MLGFFVNHYQQPILQMKFCCFTKTPLICLKKCSLKQRTWFLLIRITF